MKELEKTLNDIIEEMEKEPVYIAITGLSHYINAYQLKPGMLVTLLKDKDNLYDEEAILADIHEFGKIGYVANSTRTVPKGCHSAGRIYDTFHSHIIAVIRFVLKDVAIAEIMLKDQPIVYGFVDKRE